MVPALNLRSLILHMAVEAAVAGPNGSSPRSLATMPPPFALDEAFAKGLVPRACHLLQPFPGVVLALCGLIQRPGTGWFWRRRLQHTLVSVGSHPAWRFPTRIPCILYRLRVPLLYRYTERRAWRRWVTEASGISLAVCGAVGQKRRMPARQQRVV